MSSEPFAVLGVSTAYATGSDGNISLSPPDKADISFAYRASDDTYIITLPGFREGGLFTTGYSGSYVDSTEWQSIYSTSNVLLDGEAGRQDARIYLRWPGQQPLYSMGEALTYTSWGYWGDDLQLDGQAAAGTLGYFAYGIPTAISDVPVTGSASYTALIIGTDDQNLGGTSIYQNFFSGNVNLRFDFGAGTLEGEMHPFMCPWDCDIDLGIYRFIETVYSTGSNSFSGQFERDGALGSTVQGGWFEGLFNGPQAAEVMARWQAPYSVGGISGTMGGIWLGKKD